MPAPLPALMTTSVFGSRVKLAVTNRSSDTSPDISTWQVPVPKQPPPDQPAKDQPSRGVAVRVTVPAANA